MSDDKKNELIHHEKIDPVETLVQIVDKLHINENNTSRDVTFINKLIQRATTRKEITEAEHDSKGMAIHSYDIDGIFSQDLQASLRAIKETPQQPFTFLANIREIFSDESQLVTRATARPTEIDKELAAVAKRIESSRALLEEAKSRVNGIHLRVKRGAAVLQQSSDTCTHKYSTEGTVTKRILYTNITQFHNLHYLR